MTNERFDFIPDTCRCKSKEKLEVLDHVISLAVEIAREGREGKKIGTMFTVFDAERVISLSRCMILDPLALHDPEKKRIDNPNLRETVKELSQLDGAFVVDDDGVVLSACRYLDVKVEDIELPLGLGSRHLAAASISKQTRCVSVAVSESSIVRIFVEGKIVSEIIPEIWLLKRHSVHLDGPYSERSIEEMTVIDKKAS
jgi:DNA integrity scanning protein DisA with diadenylate cyclase activity